MRNCYTHKNAWSLYTFGVLVLFCIFYIVTSRQDVTGIYKESVIENIETLNSDESWPPLLKPSGQTGLLESRLLALPPMEREDMRNRLKIYESRSQLLKQKCENVITKPHGIKNLIWFNKTTPPITFCLIQKVSSSTWVSNFLYLSHFNEDNPDILKLPEEQQWKARFQPKYGWHHYTALKLFEGPKNTKEKLSTFKDSLRIIVVRHPFTRLVSAYRVKMLLTHPNLEDDYIYSNMKQEIITKYRNNTINKSKLPTFTEFVDYIIENYEKIRNSQSWDLFPVNVFLQQSDTCNVCTSNYNLIFKLETIQEDGQFLARYLDLEDLKNKPKFPDITRHVQNGKTSYQAAPLYFRYVSKDQIHALYEIFKPDFELFNYTLNEYIGKNM